MLICPSVKMSLTPLVYRLQGLSPLTIFSPSQKAA